MSFQYVICLVVAALVAPSSSAALLWSASVGGNDHYYEFVRAVGLTWDEARAHAETKVHAGRRGHLATITSAAEHNFLASSGICDVALYDSAWLGGFQIQGAATPSAGWRWVTGEPWSYTRWAPGKEPNDSGGPALNTENGDENYLVLWGNGWWNDDAQNTQPERSGGYIIEYGPPIPEPASALLLAGVIAFAASRRRR